MRRREVPRGSAILTMALLSLAACGGTEPPALTVGAAEFTADQLLGLSETRLESLSDLAAVALAVSDSTAGELGQPIVDAAVEDRLIEILAAELTLEKNGVEDDVLEAQYLTDPRWELEVRHILFFSERWRPDDHRRAAAEKAARAMEALRAGADFAETAATLSEEPGAEGRQGLLTPGREGSWVPEFWAAALALQPGDISPVTETQYGYHILRLEDRRVVPFGEARSAVARSVADQLEDPNAVLTAWLDETMGDENARRAAALNEASARTLAVPSAEVAEIEREWSDAVDRWAATFGFGFGGSSEQVAAAALAALARPEQGAVVSRGELEGYRDVLRNRYPVTRPAPQ